MTAGRQLLTLDRECPVVAIPAGQVTTLPVGTEAEVVQALGGAVTVRTRAGLFRIEAEVAAGLGLTDADPDADADAAEAGTGGDDDRAVAVRRNQYSMEQVLDVLHTVYDPEIPIDVLELGLVYRCEEHLGADGRRRIEVDMSMTAPGCGMGDVLKGDVERVVGTVPGVDDVEVTLVWDPPWSFDRLSDAARLRLGLL